MATPPKVPRAYECPITYQIMQDPVFIVSSGYTYERAAITNIINNGNALDPFTRHPITLEDIMPNRAIKDAIDEWKRANPTAAPALKA